MKLAGVARFDCVGYTQEFACYMAGLASPQRSHLQLDDQHAAQSPCLAILVPLGMWRLIDNKRHRGSDGWPHPLPAFYRPRSRSDAPVTSRYTRSVAVHPIRRGAMPTDRVHRLPQQARPRAIPPHRPQPSISDAATQLQNARPAPNERRCTRYVAIHPLRSDAPDQKRCNAYGSGAPPPTTSTNASIPFRHTQPTASDAATRPRHAHPGSEREALHQLASITLPPSWCNTPLSDVTPARNKQQCGYAPQHAS